MMPKPIYFIGYLGGFMALMIALASYSGGAPTFTQNQMATNTPTPTPSHTATNTPTPTPSHTATNTPTPTPSHTATNIPSPTPSHTATNIPSPTPSHTATNIPSPTPSHTATNIPASAPNQVATNTPMPRQTATNTPVPRQTATNTPSSPFSVMISCMRLPFSSSFDPNFVIFYIITYTGEQPLPVPVTVTMGVVWDGQRIPIESVNPTFTGAIGERTSVYQFATFETVYFSVNGYPELEQSINCFQVQMSYASPLAPQFQVSAQCHWISLSPPQIDVVYNIRYTTGSLPPLSFPITITQPQIAYTEIQDFSFLSDTYENIRENKQIHVRVSSPVVTFSSATHPEINLTVNCYDFITPTPRPSITNTPITRTPTP